MSQDKLEQAVENALEQNGVTETEESVDTKKENTKPPANAKEKEDDDSTLDERTTNALRLLDALEDPTRAKLVVENLARQAGLLSGEMTKKEEKQAIKGIKEIVKERLGENGSFIASEMGDLLEELVGGIEQKVTSRIEQIENERQARQYQREYDEIITREKVTDDEAGEIMKLVDEMPWNGKTPLNSYLTKLIKLHRSEVAEKNRKDETRQRQQRNIQSQTKAISAESNEERVKRGSGKISAEEAVLAALRGEKLE